MNQRFRVGAVAAIAALGSCTWFIEPDCACPDNLRCTSMNTCPNECGEDDQCLDGHWCDAQVCVFGCREDTDLDGVCEADDVCPSFDDGADFDGDTVPDGCDICPYDVDDGDDDEDGVCNATDRCDGHPDDADVDADGVPDGCDTCPGAGAGDNDLDGFCDGDDRCPGLDDRVDYDEDEIPDCSLVSPAHNWHFATGVTGWGTRGQFAAEDANGLPRSGSLQLLARTASSYVEGPCIPIVHGAEYLFGAQVRAATTDGPGVLIGTNVYSDAACGTVQGGLEIGPFEPAAWTARFQLVVMRIDSEPTTTLRSARVFAFVEASTTPSAVWMDNAIMFAPPE